MRGTATGLRPKIKTKANTSIHKKKEIYIKSGMSMFGLASTCRVIEIIYPRKDHIIPITEETLIVGCIISCAFGHPVVTCCSMLGAPILGATMLLVSGQTGKTS